MRFPLKFKHLLAFLAVFGGVALAADTIVNQGSPGTRGAWPVSLSGGGTAVIGADGGSNPTVTYAPAATSTTVNANAVACTTVGGASCTTILAAVDLMQWPNVTITLRNSGANAFTNVLLEWSPDGTNYEIWDNTTFATLAAATTSSIAITGNSRRFLRIEAQSASGTSSVVNITASSW